MQRGGLRPLLLRAPDVSPSQSFSIISGSCVWLRRGEALVEEDQSKTEVTSNRGQLPHALCWREHGRLAQIWKGWWQGRPDGSIGPRARGRKGKARTGYMHTRERERHGRFHSSKDRKRINKTRGRNCNNAIRDRLMILEGGLCGLSLIFPPHPSKLVAKKEAEQKENKDSREKDWERENRWPLLKNKKKIDERERERSGAFRQTKKKNLTASFSPGCTCGGGDGQFTAHSSHSCPSSPGWTTGLDLGQRCPTARQIVSQRQIQKCLSGLSVQSARCQH